MQLFVNDLTVMDFSYLCPQRGMVGESWIVDVILDGDLNEQSMVLDFSKVKKRLKALIDEYVDHKLLVPAEHAYTEINADQNHDLIQVNFARPGKPIQLYCPPEAYGFVYAEQVDMASVSQYLHDIIATHLPENVAGLQLNLRTEHIDGPYYHYTHGLKKHDGNCQRIAHGHRSRVQVFEQQQASEKWQQYWASRWQDIYIGTREDLVEPEQLKMALPKQSLADSYCFSYQASQGRFELIIPKQECDLVETDSTVECLAQFMVDELRKQAPGKNFQVVAFEGVGKGAIANG